MSMIYYNYVAIYMRHECIRQNRNIFLDKRPIHQLTDKLN